MSESVEPTIAQQPPSQEVPSQSVPPQPPLPPINDAPPPVVHGIDHIDPEQSESTEPSMTPQSPIPESAIPVRPGDLAAFAQLFHRFHSRVEKASAGRKYRPLRDAFDTAATEIARYSDRLDLDHIADLVVDALRQGCESGKILVVDACLDCIHRLFEYGHIGAGGSATEIALDAREEVLDNLIAMVCGCLEVKDEDVYLRMVQTLLTAATRTKSGLHQRTLLAAVRTIYNIFLNARVPGTRTTARVSLTQILNLVFSRMETETAEDVSSVSFDAAEHTNSTDVPVDVPRPAPPEEEGGDTSDVANVLQKDAYLLFRALCKLSAKEDVDTSGPDPVGIRSKLLSLELIRNLISNSGPAFRSGERFIYALRQYLAPSLLINCMWNSADVVDVSFDIFEMLLRKDTLRPLLKTEIGALFDTVIFRFLESPTAGPMRKRRAITLFSRLSSDRQTMADLFLNYDCDMDSPKIFERMVNVISAAAQDKTVSAMRPSTQPAPGTGQLDARTMSLTSVIQIVRSLREWSKPIEDSKEQMNTADGSVGSDRPSDQAEDDRRMQSDEIVSPVSNSDDKANSSQEDVGNSDSMTSRLAPSASGTIVGVVSEGSDRDTTKFEEALRAKHVVKEGIKLFNTKPKRGIEYLANKGRLQKDPVAVAEFLHKAEGLDAALVGEYLGEGDSFNINAMHAYTDMMNFTNVTFDGALRIHLGSFRLPGEAQKIERIMEKFASRYCECNPDTFANADAAFVLAFSTIMLHTDAHNTTIKHKMSKEEFIRNNRGINDGDDLDPGFLSGLYDRITKTEIRLAGAKKDSAAGDGQALNAAAAAMDPTQRARQFEQESKQLMEATKILFAKKRRPAQDYTYYSATNVYHARLMFETACFPVLAAISLNLEHSSPADSNIVALCLDGFRNGIAISSTFGMSTAKDAFVSSLAKFTHLNSISEMRPKNVECVRMVLAIAALEGNNLGEQWIVIVRAISQLEQIRAVSSGNPGKYLLQKSPLTGIGVSISEGISRENSSSTSSSAKSSERSGGDNSSMASPFRRTSSAKSTASPEKVRAMASVQRIDPKTAAMATTIAESEIERIFTNSSELPATDVADFCGALCTVALEELNEKPTPRIFCLQKIVEMAYYNMESRTRIQWGKIWAQMSPFFGSAMCHSNRDVAMYAIDALRQLASKFLDKDELSNFSFQKSFLKPFEVCFGKSKNVEVRELVLTCISQIVLARAGNIKSGWKAVFAVLALAADDRVESIMNFGWQVVDSIARKYIGVLDDVYVDAVTGISAYTRTALSTPVSLAAIELLSNRCAKSLADGAALSVLRAQLESKREVETDSSIDGGIWFTADTDAHIGAWFPILTGLAAAIQDERPPVRMAASEGLYRVLSNHGGRFSPSLWALIFRGVLSPVFDDVKHLSSHDDRAEAAAVGEWATTTGSASLRALIDVFAKHLSVTRDLLEDLLELIRGWILQQNEVVAREGMSILAKLITISGDSLEVEDWKLVVKAINAAFVDTMPHEILGPSNRNASLDQEETEAEIGDSSAEDYIEPNGVHIEENGAEKSDSNTGDSAVFTSLSNGHATDEGDSRTPRAKIDFRIVRAKCVVQLLLINLVQEVVVTFYKILSTECILAMSKSLEMSYSFAHDFNANVELRYSLWRSGFMNQVPNLLKQETNGLMAHLRIMFWLYLDPKREESGGTTEARMMDMCENVLRDYISACNDAQAKTEERREVIALSPVVSFIVNGMMQMSDSQVEKHLPNMYSILLDLVEGADDREVRRTVTKLLRLRVNPTMRIEESHSVVGKAQLPGVLRDCIVRVKFGADQGAPVGQEICTALSKVGGVQFVDESNRPDTFRVRCMSPDEMLVSGISGLPFVRLAFVDTPVEDSLD